MIGEDWQRDALCAQTDPEAFFPTTGQSGTEARRVCRGCPVRGECLQWALDNGETHGVWGGLTGQQVMRIGRGHAPWPADIPRPAAARADGEEEAA